LWWSHETGVGPQAVGRAREGNVSMPSSAGESDTGVILGLTMSPLQRAIFRASHPIERFKHIKEIEKLIADGEDVNGADDCGRTPLWHACQQGDEVIVEKLIEAGADIHKASNELKISPILRACGHSKGHTKILEMLIAKGAEVNYTDPKGWTPLMYCCLSRNFDSVKLLVKHGADKHQTVNGVIKNGGGDAGPQTPAMLARLGSAPHIASWLESDNPIQAPVINSHAA